MSQLDLLYTLAGTAVTLAGFAALMAVVAGAGAAPRSPAEGATPIAPSTLLRTVETALLTAGAALLPAVLAWFPLSQIRLWQVASGIAFLVWSGHLMVVAAWSRHAGAPGAGRWVVLIVRGVVLVLLAFNTLAVSVLGPAAYAVAVVLMAGVAGWLFLRLVAALMARSAPPG